jgi:hypothetical protein
MAASEDPACRPSANANIKVQQHERYGADSLEGMVIRETLSVTMSQCEETCVTRWGDVQQCGATFTHPALSVDPASDRIETR